jgi:hypothetical protein
VLKQLILDIHIDRIDAINGSHAKSPPAIPWHPEMTMNENMLMLMHMDYISLMVYYWNRIDGKLPNFIPCVNVSKITIRMAIGETLV